MSNIVKTPTKEELEVTVRGIRWLAGELEKVRDNMSWWEKLFASDFYQVLRRVADGVEQNLDEITEMEEKQ